MIRVLLIDDEASVRRGVRFQLGLEADIEVVGEASDGLHASDLALSLSADVAVVDVGLPSLDGLAVASAIRAAAPGTRVVILTIHDDERTKCRSYEAGASAFVSKRATGSALVDSIRRAAAAPHQERELK
jgi:DNA-binding NarL/FixJ family response regulator